VQSITRYELQLQMGVAFMNYIMNLTSYYNTANIHYSQIKQYERILVTAEYWYKWQAHANLTGTLIIRRQTTRIIIGSELDHSDVHR
jgi:hypothetical protein